MKKKLLSLSLALALCLGLSATALADSSATNSETDITSPLVVKGGLDYDYMTQLDNGYYKVEKGGKYGLLDSNGNKIIPPVYDRIGDISGGMVKVYQGKGYSEEKYGFVNVSTGELTIPIQYESAEKYEDGSVTIQLSDFSNGYAVLTHTERSTYREPGVPVAIAKITVKCGLMDKKGNMVIPLAEQSFSTSWKWEAGFGGSRAYFFDDNRVVARVGEKWVVMDTSGKVLFAPNFYDVSGYVNGFAIVTNSNGKKGCIDTQGNLVVPVEYDTIREFRNGYAIVGKYSNQGDLYGAVNQQGKLVVPMIYNYMDDFYEDMARVQIKSPDAVILSYKYGYVNTSGELVVPAIYESLDLDLYSGLGNFHNGLACVAIMDERFSDIDIYEARMQRKHGYIDKLGNVVIPIIYSTGSDFSGGVALVDKGTFGGIHNKNLRGYDEVRSRFEELGIDIEYYYIDTTGKVIASDKNLHKYGTERFYVDKINGKFAIMRNPFYPENATPTRSTVLVNGQNVAFDAYNINGNNYFKLRDLAKVLSGTGKQFEVTWDGQNNAINLLSGKPYTTVGGELAQGDGTTKTALISTSTIYLDGQSVSLLAYNIGGNNYFKLQDVGQAFDFNVSWDGARNTIVIDTAQSYTPD